MVQHGQCHPRGKPQHQQTACKQPSPLPHQQAWLCIGAGRTSSQVPITPGTTIGVPPEVTARFGQVRAARVPAEHGLGWLLHASPRLQRLNEGVPWTHPHQHLNAHVHTFMHACAHTLPCTTHDNICAAHRHAHRQNHVCRLLRIFTCCCELKTATTYHTYHACYFLETATTYHACYFAFLLLYLQYL